MLTLTIDKEFQSKIPPLTEAEFKQLEENIVSAGEVWEPIVVWNGTIIDGHNRYAIVQKHPEVTWKTRDMDFTDKWEAFDWMYKNQLGRRNLTDEQKTFLLGKLYEASKHVHGFHTENRNPDGTFQSAQKEHTGDGRIAEQIAKEQGVGKETVKRAEQFAKGIDAIRETDPSLADDILTAKKKVTKVAVSAIPKAAPQDKKKIIDAIKSGVPARRVAPNAFEHRPVLAVPKDKYRGGGSAEYHKVRDQTAKSVAKMYDTTPVEFTINDLTESIKNTMEPYVSMLETAIKTHIELCKQNRETLCEVIDSIASKITNIKEMI